MTVCIALRPDLRREPNPCTCSQQCLSSHAHICRLGMPPFFSCSPRDKHLAVKILDRRSGNMAVRHNGTLHSSLSYSAHDPYGRYKSTFDPSWSRLVGGSARTTPAAEGPIPLRQQSASHGGLKFKGKGTMLIVVQNEAGREALVPTYNVTNSIAAGLPATQILHRSLAHGTQDTLKVPEPLD